MDRLLQQAESSAQAYLFGLFDYNKAPLAPPGVKMLAHDKSDQRSSWAPNEKIGIVVGPTLEPYLCLMYCFPEPRLTRLVDTLTYFPYKIPILKVKLEDFYNKL